MVLSLHAAINANFSYGTDKALQAEIVMGVETPIT
jgi:hypothetical protein